VVAAGAGAGAGAVVSVTETAAATTRAVAAVGGPATVLLSAIANEIFNDIEPG